MNRKALRRKSTSIAQSRVDMRDTFIKLQANFEDHQNQDNRMFQEIIKRLDEMSGDIKTLLGDKNQRDGENKMKRGLIGGAMVIIPTIISIGWHYIFKK